LISVVIKNWCKDKDGFETAKLFFERGKKIADPIKGLPLIYVEFK